MSKPEQKHQIAVANQLRLEFPNLLWTISPAGLITRPSTGILAVRMGYRKGTSDLLIFEPRGWFHGLFIELKANDGKPSDEQLKFLAQAGFLRYATAVTWTFEETMSTVRNYMALEPFSRKVVINNGVLNEKG